VKFRHEKTWDRQFNDGTAASAPRWASSCGSAKEESPVELWKSNIARSGVQAVFWAFGVATVVSAVLAAIVLFIASVNDGAHQPAATPTDAQTAHR
jgi:hypothetical protein